MRSQRMLLRRGYVCCRTDRSASAGIHRKRRQEDIDFRAAEGTNDASLQISQIETFINEGVDAIVLLPTDGAALTDVAMQAMQAGIPVVNVDREFSSPFAARTTILGDNCGMGVSAGAYGCQLIEENDIADSSSAAPARATRCSGFRTARWRPRCCTHRRRLRTAFAWPA
jgi:ABC-type sugar transport system substrate-binding protein